MKKKFSKILVFAILILLPICANAVIIDVNIIPSTPTTLDVISIFTSGSEGAGIVTTDSNFSQDGTSLKLDIFIELDWEPWIQQWSYTKVIGMLPEGFYNLTVSEFGRTQGGHGPFVPGTTSSTSFEVTPEPTTLVFLTIGFSVYRAVMRRKT